MVAQAIRNWLGRLFSWWPWKQPAEIEHTHVASPLNKGTTQEAISRSAIDGTASHSQQGIVPRLSTIDEWPERFVKPVSPPPQPLLPPPASSELPDTPFPSPLTSPVDKGKEGSINWTSIDKATDIFSSDVPSTPAPISGGVPTFEQQLEVLPYLIRRGIVNEGFEEGKVPEQYRREQE
jgi:hypothetical protein